MRSMLNRFTVFFIIVCLFSVPLASSAFAQSPVENEEQVATERMAFDACIVRPAGIAGALFGCGAFIISLPFSLLGGNTKEAFDTLVKQPVKYTFARPLGDF